LVAKLGISELTHGYSALGLLNDQQIPAIAVLNILEPVIEIVHVLDFNDILSDRRAIKIRSLPVNHNGSILRIDRGDWFLHNSWPSASLNKLN